MMKRLSVLLAVLMFVGVAKAAPGDTTWVQAHTNVQMPNFGNFDQPVTFPDGSVSYRKVVMIVTLGKYQCPGNPQYCGDWDYTFQTFLMPPSGDTLELGRLITPYANVSYARFPWTWKERYTFDVTDYYPVLKNSADIRIHYSGYSGGFTADIKFAFVEGTPERNVLGVERLWHGSFAYGKAADPIEDHLPALSKTVATGAESAEMKLNITGHGADDNGCSEFCKKYYQVLVNSTMTDQKDIWRDDCGFNNLYPQSGTWVYDRGNWCPGALVRTNVHKLGSIKGGDAYDVNLDLEPYNGSGSYGSYTIDAAVFYYGAFNKQVDASLEDIIAPTNHEAHFRANPATAYPVIKVKNTGSTTITSVKIEYGMPGKYMPQYTWNGTIDPLKEMEITLPELWELRSETGTNLNFTAKIIAVNGQADADDKNNTLTSVFDAAPSWPDLLEIMFQTNSSVEGGVSETSYKIYDAGNNVILEHSNAAPNTLYRDTLQIGPGYYKIVVEDKGCDGLNFWANSGAGSGLFRVKKLGVITPLVLNGYFNGDFGCGFTQYFNMNWPTAVQDINNSLNVSMDVYPNPAHSVITVSLNGLANTDGTFRITDATGRIVLAEKCTAAVQQVNVAALASGIYSIDYTDASGVSILRNKVVITK
jgi:hypothetical protein